MAQIAPIAIADGKTPTAQTHTFNPVSTAPIAEYREAIASLPLIGQGTLTAENRSPSSAALQRVKVKLALPAIEVVSGQNAAGYTGAPKVAYVNTVMVEFLLPVRGTVDQRKDLRVLLSNSLMNAQFVDLIDNLNVPY